MFNLLPFLLFVILSVNFNAQDYWIRQPSPTSEYLSKSIFTDSSNGWAAGEGGVIIHTSNAGISWELQRTGIVNAIQDIYFLNSRLGWAISNDYFSYGTMILTTTNSGTNWDISRFPDSTLIITSVNFTDSLTGYLGGIYGTVLKTTNGGLNWTKCILDSNFYSFFPITGLVFFNQQTGFAIGGQMEMSGVIWRTSNAGQNWNLVDTTTEPVADIFFYDSNYVFASGGDFDIGSTLFRSTDGGRTWIDSTYGFFGTGLSVALRTLHDIWVPLGFSGKWVNSTDMGVSWLSLDAPDSCAINSALFIDSIRGWAFGTNGSIYKYNYNHEIGIINNSVPAAFKLNQNYPNPFNPFTVIKYELMRAADIKIILYDVTGKEVKKLMSGFKYPGKYELIFSPEGLSSGVYFYRIEIQPDEIVTDGYSETKKMIILK